MSAAVSDHENFRADFAGCSGWMWPLRRVALEFATASAFPDHEALTSLYDRCSHADAPRLRFVSQTKARRRRGHTPPASERYDGRIALDREVPTRVDNWHDLLNALCFTVYSRSKCALHARQYRALCAIDPGPAARWPGARTREQDALTLFDEGGVVIAARSADVAALVSHSADVELVYQACRQGYARLVPFGHALLEHLVLGKDCPFGSARAVEVHCALDDDEALTQAVDCALSRLIADPAQFTEPRSHASHVMLLAGLDGGVGGSAHAPELR